jgi:hypothetical protein
LDGRMKNETEQQEGMNLEMPTAVTMEMKFSVI